MFLRTSWLVDCSGNLLFKNPHRNKKKKKCDNYADQEVFVCTMWEISLFPETWFCALNQQKKNKNIPALKGKQGGQILLNVQYTVTVQHRITLA